MAGWSTGINMAIELSEKQIKDGWKIVKFGEIARNISQRVEPGETNLDVYVGLEHLDPQSLRITRKGVPSDVKGQKLRVRPGQIIFGKRRAYQKKLAVADFDGICSAHAMVIEEIPGKIIPGLLPFLMQSDMFMDRAVAISEGSLSPTIKWKTLAVQEFPLPPLERQKEILKVLEKIEACLEKAKYVICSAEQIEVSYISKRMPLNFRKTSSNIKKISDFLNESRIQGNSGANSNKITVKLYGKGAVAKENNYGSYNTKYFVRKEGQFIYSKLDFLNGAFAVIPEKLDGFETTADLPAFDVSEDLNPQWLYYYVTREAFYKNFINHAKGGRKAKRISPEDFLNTNIPMQSKTEQNAIVHDIQQIEHIINIVKTKILKLHGLKSEIVRGAQ